jgi:hypothetical protein
VPRGTSRATTDATDGSAGSWNPWSAQGSAGREGGDARSDAVVYLAGGTDPLTPEAMRAFHLEAARYGVKLRWEHSDWKKTDCAGVACRRWRKADFVLPRVPPPPPPAPPKPAPPKPPAPKPPVPPTKEHPLEALSPREQRELLDRVRLLTDGAPKYGVPPVHVAAAETMYLVAGIKKGPITRAEAHARHASQAVGGELRRGLRAVGRHLGLPVVKGEVRDLEA